MAVTDPRIDEYIEKSQEFARPILNHLRKLLHKACPGVEETIKWGFPHFMYHNGILCSFASFKQHCAFGFWKASLMQDPEGRFNKNGYTAMGQFDRICTLKDLPADKVLLAYIREAAQLNEAGIKKPEKARPATPKEIIVPDDVAAALQQNTKARTVFEAFSPSHQREYLEWITDAKTTATRNKRLATAIAWMAEGKGRNWKYEKK